MTGFAADEGTRFQGSSGGVLSALAVHALESGMVDAVLHVAADPKRPSYNRMTLSDQPEQIISGAGSRYASSSPLEDIDALLQRDDRILFIGKPCDVSALRMLSTIDSRVDERFPIKLAFFCAGVPSHRGAGRIIGAMGLDPDHVTIFRYRGEGWPGLTKAVDDKGNVGEMPYSESWGGYLSKELQFRCKICPDAVGGVADIACADAWYGDETGYPLFDEADGRSLIMTRTFVGDDLLTDAMAKGKIVAESLPIDEIRKMQPYQAARKSRIAARTAACQTLGRPVPKMKGLKLKGARRDESFKRLFREYIGTIRRIILKRD